MPSSDYEKDLDEIVFLNELSKEEIESLNELAFDDYLAHHGVGHDDDPPGPGSGRFTWGSGENPGQHLTGYVARRRELKAKGFTEQQIAEALGYKSVAELRENIPLDKTRKELKAHGLTETEIAKELGFKSTAELRAHVSMEKERRQVYYANKIPEMHKTMNNTEIAKQLDVSEGTVRNYLKNDKQIKYDKTRNVAEMIKEELKTKHFIDVGPGAELEKGISRERMKTAIEMLKAEGYKPYYIQVEQLGNPGKFTTITTIGEPTDDPKGDWKRLKDDPSLIKPLTSYVEGDGLEIQRMLPPKSIDSKRVYINYTNPDGSGGAEKDGTIELRRGVEDISLGRSMYSQVRIAVDGTHYMKGMAHYSDDIPDGYDVVYNTNKKVGTDKYDVFKKMERDINGNIVADNPFGATIKPLDAGGQSFCLDQNGNKTDQLRVINKVNDQGDWLEWKKTISSQVLAKQNVPIVKRQLDLTYKEKLEEYNELKNLTNPTLKRQLLESFADDCDASAIHLKAKAFNNQMAHVIMPLTTLKIGSDGVHECYAPNYEHGETLALIRYPHEGKFEIPIVRNNKNNAEAKSFMRNAPDAIGIDAYTAETLSGADFDGDTVVAIPVKSSGIKNAPRLEGLIGFDSKSYKIPGAPESLKHDANGKIIDKRYMTAKNKGMEMGKITNLIADMTALGSGQGGLNLTEDEMTRAVKYAMVVIDANKHYLDYKQCYKDNRIAELKAKYQSGGGAQTIMTKAKNPAYDDPRKPGTIYLTADGKETTKDDPNGKSYYGIDPRTGERIWKQEKETYMKKSPTKADPDRRIEVEVKEKAPRMKYETDARNLMSSKSNPHPVEVVYANYANDMKALANEARREMVNTPKLKRDPQAAREYAEEVKQLDADLAIALKNAPRERQAQAIGTAMFKSILESNPEIKEDADKKKKYRGQYLRAARERVGASKKRIEITDREWEAIQARAISDSKLKRILENTDTDELKKRATPRQANEISSAVAASIRALAKQNGVTQADIAAQFGLSASAVSKIVNGG